MSIELNDSLFNFIFKKSSFLPQDDTKNVNRHLPTLYQMMLLLSFRLQTPSE